MSVDECVSTVASLNAGSRRSFSMLCEVGRGRRSGKCGLCPILKYIRIFK
jgi:hypothetical protein